MLCTLLSYNGPSPLLPPGFENPSEIIYAATKVNIISPIEIPSLIDTDFTYNTSWTIQYYIDFSHYYSHISVYNR